ncbi:MAG: tetratricopeptide repeat protein [Pseudomonadota bacterium]
MPRSSAIQYTPFSAMAIAIMMMLVLGGCQLVAKSPSSSSLTVADDDPLQYAPPVTRGLDAEGLSLLIGAELAAQRGDYQRASQGYLDATQRYPVAALAERATFTARYSDVPNLLLDATRRWQELAPDTTAPNRLLAAITLQQGQWVESLEQRLAIARAGEEADLTALAEFAIAENGPISALLERLHAYLATQDVASLKSDPLIAAALLETALGDTQAAEAKLETAKAKGDSRRPLWLAVARLGLETQDYTKARQAARQGLADNPEDVRFILLLAQTEIRLGNIDAAQQQTNQLLENHQGGDELRLALAQLYLDEGYPEPAQQLLQPFIGQPQVPDRTYILLGEIALVEQEIDNALLYFRQVGEGDEFIPARARAASMLIDNQRLLDARAFLRIERMAHDQYYNSLLMLEIQLLDEYGQTQEADQLLDRELARTPDDSTLLYQRAMRAWEAGDLEQMEADLKRLLANEPDNANALNALGYTLADENLDGRLDEAQRLIERAYELAPDDPAVLDSMGWVYYRQGEPQRALDWLERAFAAMPEQEIAAHLAEVLHELGRSEEARELIDNLMRQTSEHPAIDELLERRPSLAP